MDTSEHRNKLNHYYNSERDFLAFRNNHYLNYYLLQKISIFNCQIPRNYFQIAQFLLNYYYIHYLEHKNAFKNYLQINQF